MWCHLDERSLADPESRTAFEEVDPRLVGLARTLGAGPVAAFFRVALPLAWRGVLAGVVLANSEYRHELESDIDPFKGLLLGLFFMAVGMSIDFGLLGRQAVLMYWDGSPLPPPPSSPETFSMTRVIQEGVNRNWERLMKLSETTAASGTESEE